MGNCCSLPQPTISTDHPLYRKRHRDVVLAQPSEPCGGGSDDGGDDGGFGGSYDDYDEEYDYNGEGGEYSGSGDCKDGKDCYGIGGSTDGDGANNYDRNDVNTKNGMNSNKKRNFTINKPIKDEPKFINGRESRCLNKKRGGNSYATSIHGNNGKTIQNGKHEDNNVKTNGPTERPSVGHVYVGENDNVTESGAVDGVILSKPNNIYSKVRERKESQQEIETGRTKTCANKSGDHDHEIADVTTPKTQIKKYDDVKKVINLKLSKEGNNKNNGNRTSEIHSLCECHPKSKSCSDQCSTVTIKNLQNSTSLLSDNDCRISESLDPPKASNSPKTECQRQSNDRMENTISKNVNTEKYRSNSFSVVSTNNQKYLQEAPPNCSSDSQHPLKNSKIDKDEIVVQSEMVSSPMKCVNSNLSTSGKNNYVNRKQVFKTPIRKTSPKRSTCQPVNENIVIESEAKAIKSKSLSRQISDVFAVSDAPPSENCFKLKNDTGSSIQPNTTVTVAIAKLQKVTTDVSLHIVPYDTNELAPVIRAHVDRKELRELIRDFRNDTSLMRDPCKEYLDDDMFYEAKAVHHFTLVSTMIAMDSCGSSCLNMSMSTCRSENEQSTLDVHDAVSVGRRTPRSSSSKNGRKYAKKETVEMKKKNTYSTPKRNEVPGDLIGIVYQDSFSSDNCNGLDTKMNFETKRFDSDSEVSQICDKKKENISLKSDASLKLINSDKLNFSRMSETVNENDNSAIRKSSNSPRIAWESNENPQTLNKSCSKENSFSTPTKQNSSPILNRNSIFVTGNLAKSDVFRSGADSSKNNDDFDFFEDDFEPYNTPPKDSDFPSLMNKSSQQSISHNSNMSVCSPKVPLHLNDDCLQLESKYSPLLEKSPRLANCSFTNKDSTSSLKSNGSGSPHFSHFATLSGRSPTFSKRKLFSLDENEGFDEPYSSPRNSYSHDNDNCELSFDKRLSPTLDNEGCSSPKYDRSSSFNKSSTPHTPRRTHNNLNIVNDSQDLDPEELFDFRTTDGQELDDPFSNSIEEDTSNLTESQMGNNCDNNNKSNGSEEESARNRPSIRLNNLVTVNSKGISIGALGCELKIGRKIELNILGKKAF